MLIVVSGLPGTGINSIVLKKIEGGAETTVTMPPQARISHLKFSPDGAHLAFLQTKDTGIELWKTIAPLMFPSASASLPRVSAPFTRRSRAFSCCSSRSP